MLNRISFNPAVAANHRIGFGNLQIENDDTVASLVAYNVARKGKREGKEVGIIERPTVPGRTAYDIVWDEKNSKDLTKAKRERNDYSPTGETNLPDMYVISKYQPIW